MAEGVRIRRLIVSAAAAAGACAFPFHPAIAQIATAAVDDAIPPKILDAAFFNGALWVRRESGSLERVDLSSGMSETIADAVWDLFANAEGLWIIRAEESRHVVARAGASAAFEDVVTVPDAVGDDFYLGLLDGAPVIFGEDYYWRWGGAEWSSTPYPVRVPIPVAGYIPAYPDAWAATGGNLNLVFNWGEWGSTLIVGENEGRGVRVRYTDAIYDDAGRIVEIVEDGFDAYTAADNIENIEPDPEHPGCVIGLARGVLANRIIRVRRRGGAGVWAPPFGSNVYRR